MKGNKTKRGKTASGAPKWRLRVFVGRDLSGKQIAVSETFVGSAREADRRLAAMIDEVHPNGAPGETTTERTFVAVLEHWRAVDARQLSPTTVRNYESYLRRYVLPRFGERRVTTIATAELERLYTELSDAGLSPRTVHQVHSATSAVLTCAVRNGWIARNPARGTRRDRMEWRPPTAPGRADLPKLLAGIGEDDAFRTLVLVAVASGARRGELVALRWSDLVGDRLTIERAIVHGNDTKGELVEKDTKTHAARRVALPKYALDALDEHAQRAGALAKSCGVELAPNAYVFSDDPAGRVPWRPDYVTTKFVVARNRAELPAVRFHDLRHMAASLALEAGASVAAVRDRLGHRDLSTTNLYVHADDETDAAIATRENERMGVALGI